MWAKQSGVTLRSIFRFVGMRTAQSLMAKANTPLMFCSHSPVNQIPLRSRSDIKYLQKAYFYFYFPVYNEIIEYVSVKAVVR